jgi:magnesium transporter
VLKASGEIDEHTLSSALDPDEIARLEIEPDHFSVIWKRPHKFAANGSLSCEVSSMGMSAIAKICEISVSR